MSQSIVQDSDSVLPTDEGLNLEKVQIIKELYPIWEKQRLPVKKSFR